MAGEIPVLDTFDIPKLGIYLVDLRSESVTSDEERESRCVLWDMLQGGVLNRERPGVSLCKDVDDDVLESKLQSIEFAVFDDRDEVIGGFNLYNIFPMHWSSDAHQVLSAMPVPGCMPLGLMSFREVWGGIMKQILSAVFTFEGSEHTMAIEQFEFPTLAGHHWDGGGLEIIKYARPVKGIIESHKDGYPVRLSRGRED